MKITFPMLDSSLIAFFGCCFFFYYWKTHLIACLLAHWGVDTTQAHVQTQNFLCFSDFNLGCLWPPPELSNYFGTDDKLGPVALSIRREKLEDTKDLKDQYQYRLIVRTSEVCVCVFMCLYADHGGFQSESVNYSTAFSFSRPTCDTCPHYNLPSVPSPLCSSLFCSLSVENSTCSVQAH